MKDAAHCPSCRRSNRPGARFCSACGASLALRCPACGAANDPEARFCDACGGALGEKAIARKVVTVVFADLIGSVSLQERLDAESTRRVMDRYHRAMTAAVEVHGGRVVQLLGDGVLAAFGVPRVAEDDAMRAVRAGAGMQRAFRELLREQGEAMEAVGLRVAVNTGEVVVSEDETAVIGDPANVAARLQQEARDGDVLVGEATQRLVADLVTLAPLGTFALRGRSESVAAFRLVSLERPPSARAAAFVGRDQELRRLLAAYDAAVTAPGARLAVLLGSPGLGKSRLVAEVTRRTSARATVFTARCDAAGGATFAPIADALRAFLRIDEGAGGDVLRAAIDAVVPGDEAERMRIAAGIGALFSGAPTSPEETFFAVRRLLAALAAVRPVVLVIDDLHWGEPLLLDLVEHLVQWSAGVRLFLLVAARPELREARAALAAPGPLVTDVVTLGGLDAGAATKLAADVVGASELPAALVGRVLATSEGNPLFLAELVRMLVQDGTLVREGDRWVTTVEVSTLDMPPTIQVLLGARIERLRPEDRAVLERAAVVGRHFSRAAVAELLGPAATDLDARLESLRRSELIETDTGWFLGEPVLRFHHVLIRDAAYRRVLKETRAELHERLADWVIARAGESTEHDETIGWHLEQAHQNLRELGGLDAHGRGLGERAARHLGAAGRRALAREDLALAANLLGRAIERLESEDPARGEFALEWCEALLAAGEVGTATGAIAELRRFAGGSERFAAWQACFAGQLAALTDPQSLREVSNEVTRAAASLAAAGDAAGEAKAHSVHAGALARLGQIGACETALDQALAAARRARDRRRSNAVLAGAPLAALWGPSPVARASGRCLDVVRVLRITQGAPGVEAVALRCQAVLETLRGRTGAARRMIAAARALVEELGIAQQLLESDVFAGLIELLQGDAEAAEVLLRGAYEGLRERGLGIDAARAAALLGRALLAQGRAADAEALSHESEVLGGDDLKASIAWRGVRAEALARRGESEPAVELARAAVAIASATDALLDHADARLALATALRAARRTAEAAAEEARAVELWETKGATLLSGRLRRADAAADAQVLRAPPAGAPARGALPRLQPNLATESQARVVAAVTARDFDGFLSLFSADAVEVHHQTGAVLDAAEARRLYERLLAAEMEGFRIAGEPLATLGAHLALTRTHISLASAHAGEQVSVGETDMSSITLVEVGPDGLRTRTEFFAIDRVANAVARLYECDAALLPEGPARDAAVMRARCVAAVLTLTGMDDFDALVVPDMAFVDHRVLGFEASRGPWDLGRMHALHAFAENVSVRVDDILVLGRDALLLRTCTCGTERQGGGRFERPMLQIRCFGVDGRMTRTEWFDADRDEVALARFAELTPSGAPGTRRVRSNGATENIARLDAAVAARDRTAVAAVFAADFEAVHHPLHTQWGHEGALTSLDAVLAADDPVFRNEPIATLGDALAMCRQYVHSSGISLDDLECGAIDVDYWWLVEVNEKGLRARAECYAATELAAALIRLYERYAECLPDGPLRAAAATTARCVAGLYRRVPSLVESTAGGESEFLDHRRLGLLRSGRVGAADIASDLGSLSELTRDVSITVDELLRVRPDAFLVRATTRGRDRGRGGAFEQVRLDLRCFDVAGRLLRSEWFDAEQENEAIARFDELVGEAPPRGWPNASPDDAIARRDARVAEIGSGRQDVRRPPPENAATRAARASVSAMRERHIEALENVFAEDLRSLSHETGVEMSSDEMLARARYAIDYGVALQFDLVPLAALGDSLALTRMEGSSRAIADPALPAGENEVRALNIGEVGPDGRLRRLEQFPAGQIGRALTRLYERWAETVPATERARASNVARAVAAVTTVPDLDALAPLLAPDLAFADRRTLGMGPASGAERYLRGLQSLLEAVRDLHNQDEVIAADENGLLVRRHGTSILRDGGGTAVHDILMLWAFGADGRITHIEMFDPEAEDAALARFEALSPRDVASPALENTATRRMEGFQRLWNSGDWETLEATTPARLERIDRRRMLRAELDRSQHLDWMRMNFELRGSKYHRTPLATRGDRLALDRWRFEAADGDVGPSQVDFLLVASTAVGDESAVGIIFDVDDLDAAYTELDARYAAGEGAPYAGLLATFAELARAWRARDLEALARVFPESFTSTSHRRLVTTGETLDRAAWIASCGALDALGVDDAVRTDHLRISPNAALRAGVVHGTRDGGAFEIPVIFVYAHDGIRPLSQDLYDGDQIDAAVARFEEIEAAATSKPAAGWLRPNAAVAAHDRSLAAFAARDWEAMRAAFAPDGSIEERRAGLRTPPADGGTAVAALRELIGTFAGTRTHRSLFAVFGDHVALERQTWHGGPADGRFETEMLTLVEADAEGRIVALISFDADDVVTAHREASERWIAREPQYAPLVRAGLAYADATRARDATALRALLADDLVVDDRRRTGFGRLEDADALVDSFRALWELTQVNSSLVRARLAVEPWGSVLISHVAGALTDGGAFDSISGAIAVFEDGLFRRFEFFEVDDIEDALARFEAMRRERARRDPR